MTEQVGSSQPLSRRQRLLGLAKSTRDNYIPKLTDSVSQLASGVSSRAFGPSSTSDMYDAQGNLIFPKDTTLTLFPTYTRRSQDENKSYHVDVRGWLSCPGLMTRKNRLILSLARQITKYNSNSQATNQAISKLEDESLSQDVLGNDPDTPDSDVESVRTEFSTNSGSNSPRPSSNEDMIKERLACFIARSIPYAELEVSIGPKHNQDQSLVSPKKIKTDVNGHFDLCVDVDYEPSFIQVKAVTDETIFAFQDILITPNEGIGVISDIDDTVKLTGVVGDKRELMTNLLLKDVSSWRINPVIQWYFKLSDQKVSFHYVSNSPWQLFNTIDQYFKSTHLPNGSFHLKQYTGNIIASIMEPSSSRKKRSLTKILGDFPQKRFICVGDSGEYDLEAYVELAQANPDRVVAIYIRFVEDSLSFIDDRKILEESNRIIGIKKRKLITSPKPAEVEDLIDLSDSSPVLGPSSAPVRKLPPMVPTKPSSLKGTNLQRKPPLPSRDRLNGSFKSFTDSDVPGGFIDNQSLKSSKTEPTSHRRSSNHSGPRSPNPSSYSARSAPANPNEASEYNNLDDLSNILNTQKYYDLEETDSKGAQWIRRIVAALEALEDTGTELKLFVDDNNDFVTHSERVLKNYLKPDRGPQDIL